jgi:hypothetical protein
MISYGKVRKGLNRVEGYIVSRSEVKLNTVLQYMINWKAKTGRPVFQEKRELFTQHHNTDIYKEAKSVSQSY